MANWTVDFMSRTGASYQITIEGAPGNVDIPLTPGEDPFTTEEEGKSDLFIFVKRQTGYINIVTDDVNLVRTIIPLSGGTRRVRVYDNGGNIVWQGFVQPKLLSMKIWRGKQKIQIPVECPLSALKYKTFQTILVHMSVHAVIWNILGQYFNNYYMQGSCINNVSKEDYQRSWLSKQVTTSLFTSQSLTCEDVLEAICVFYGWTVRSFGTDCYFVANRNIDNNGSKALCCVSDDEMSSGDIKSTTADWVEDDLTGSMLADANTKMILTEGVRGVNVQCSLNSFNFSGNLPDEDIAQAINDGVLSAKWIDTSYTEEEYRVSRGYWDYVRNVHINGWTIDTYNTKFYLYKHDSDDVEEWTYSLKVEVTDWYGYHIDDPSSDRYLGSYYGYIVLLSDEIFSPSEGIITITPKRDSDYQRVTFNVQIGDMLYVPDSQTWVDVNTERGGHPIIVDYDNPSANIPIPPAGLSGKLKITYLTDQQTRMFYIYGTDFEFTSKETQDINSSISEVSHSASGNSQFSKDEKIDAQLCVQEAYIQNSRNFVLDTDGRTPITGIFDYVDSVSAFNPLQRLANNAATEMNTVAEMYQINIRRELFDGEITPLSILYMEELDANLYPVSIGRDWHDEVLKLKLLKRKISNQM